jgi:phage terminase small subunit
MANPKRLTAKQLRFIAAYLGEAKGNGTAAARIAGYKDAQQSAYDVKTNLEVRAAIDAQLTAETLSAAEVLHHLTDVGMAEWHEFVEVIVNPRTGKTMKVRMDLTNKVKALELLGKFHKLFTDKSEATSNVLIREYTDGDA